MYPRNAASPERIAVGAVVQISDGAVQTSGVSISVRGQGGASGAGAGTTAYDNGIVEYTPTQGETDYTSFIVVAYKTGCIPVSQTIITSASATPGYAGVDWSKVTAPTTTLNLSGTTVKTATDVETGTADIQSRLPAALVGGRIDANAGAISGDATAADNLEAALDGTGGVTITAALTGNVTGNLSGSVGSVTGAVGSVTGAVGSVTGNVGGNVAGSVASVTAGVTVTTNNDKTGYRLSATGVDDILDEVVEGTTTLRQYVRGIASALLAKLSGAATTTVVVRDVGDSKDRITATVDADGNRSAVTLDLT